MKTDVDFWESRYLAGRTPWDSGRVPAALSAWLAREASAGKVLVPGCGSGYELKAFSEAGWEVTGIDYAPAAVARARANCPELTDRIVQGDFFAHAFEPGQFDVIYERTFLCALPPDRWPAYGARIEQLLASRGRLVGFFFFGEQPDPPPHPLQPGQQEALLGPDFARLEDAEVSDSLPLFAGRERWQIWQKRG